MKKLKFNFRHVICVLIILSSVVCSVFIYFNAFGRVIESLKDFGLSAGYYFCELFMIPHGIIPTVNDLPKIPFFDFITPSSPSLPLPSLPSTWDGFIEKWNKYWQCFKTQENFFAYLNFINTLLYNFSKFIVLILPLIFALYMYIRSYLSKHNNNYDLDSKPLQCFKWLVAHTYTPIKKQVILFYNLVKTYKAYYITFICIWLFNFNIFTIFIEFLAYYLYFVISFDSISIYRQVYKLFIDLTPLTTVPTFIWVIVGLVCFDMFRKSIAHARLHHFEMRNRGFINERPIVYMVCGTMGKKKTTAITDMALSQEVMFRDKAFEKILENDLKFPFFPWCNLENELKRAMEYHEIYNLATVRKLIHKKKLRFEKQQTKSRLFNYDYEKYGLEYNDKLKVVDIWEVIETYAQLYFIYIIQSSLLIANYSVRVDGVLSDLGNFPLWNADFFKRDSRLMQSYSRHAHILDFDSLRLGKKVLENNIKANNFEFGVVVITEVGKERGNNLELQEKKRKDETANQKNDNFNGWLKMVRHSATVDNFPFVRVITDEQRPESWGADARNLCEIVHIKDTSETRLAMPFFSLTELLYSWLFSKFTGLYYQYRFMRADNTLPMYILKGLTAKINHYYTGIYNRFGYCLLNVQVESGIQDGRFDDNKYFIMSKKIYSKRFSTDCFSDFFTQKSLRSPIGIDDLREYATEKATFNELSEQNSYFISDLLGGLINKD